MVMRRLSDIVAQIAADRLRERIERSAVARKEAALFAWQTMGDMPYLKMLNMIEARIHSRTDPDPAALRYLGHRLCRMADEAERRQEASGDRAQPPSPLASIYKAGL